MRGERGQATIEWTAVVLLVALVLGAATYTAAALDAPWLGRTIRCAILAGCHGEDAELESVYGSDAAAFVPHVRAEHRLRARDADAAGRLPRVHVAPLLRCPGRARGGVWMTSAGRRATVFIHVVDRRGSGGDLFVQYWLYYPDSTYFGPTHAAAKGHAQDGRAHAGGGHHPHGGGTSSG